MIASLLIAQLDKVESGLLSQSGLLFLVALNVVASSVGIWNGIRLRPPHEAPTRREFDELKGKVEKLEGDVPPMERRLLDAMERMSDRLAKKIDKLEGDSHAANQEIFKRLNENDKVIARLEEQQKS